jgi:DNA mismatch repair protein MutS
VEFFYRNQILLSNLREGLATILDVERIASKIAVGKAHAKDLLSVKSSLSAMRSILDLVNDFPEIQNLTAVLTKAIPNIEELIALLERSIKEEPSVGLNEGNIIKDGYNQELDRLRKVKGNARSLLEGILNKQREKSGITNLKLRYNRIIGYFFEVTKSNLHLVPDTFVRRQSLVGSERFTTNDLAQIESEINNAEERIVELERELFLEIREITKKQVPLIMEFAHFTSEIDVFQSFAFAATIHGYSKPTLTTGRDLKIIDGRHPVVEANLHQGAFIPNSIQLDKNTGFFVLLTGPNMAGKSTFLRQIALIVLMAQIGSFVPAQEAVVGIVDSIFCRVGASDNLARGESTFLVEMNETANILHAASPSSLLLMDEIGRGTGTNDGFSIAWAVSEYILEEIRAKTLFATHYHELANLRNRSILKLTMEVLEEKDQIVFLKRVKKGSTSNSYGIHVAKLAGLPDEVIERARQILDTVSEKSQLSPPSATNNESGNHQQQHQLFASQELIIDELLNIDINNITPLQALEYLVKWQDYERKR